MKGQLPRKLAAILYADVADYSRLTGEDEDATHRRLSEYLDLVSNSIGHHQGRVVHYAGDAVLADFSTVTNALECASSIQGDLYNRNLEFPDKRKVQFRIGINLGEVIVDRDDIYGNGVNVAARLESLADAGGVCISDAVRTAIGNKLPLEYEFMGEQVVKNIKEPIRAYQVRLLSEEQPEESIAELPELKLPEEPSIAVLPFTNMSDDPEQEYFCDGISEDIITALSKISALLVIARNSTFIYKGKAVDIKEVGRDQGVRYVLEGSVRKSSGRVRITAQLIDAEAGDHVWAERYDRRLEDIFDVQDEITRKVVDALDVQLIYGEQARLWSDGTKNLEAWECFRIAEDLLSRFKPEDLPLAKRQAEKAVALDPEYALAWVLLAGFYNHHADEPGLTQEERQHALIMVKQCADKALEVDSSCVKAYSSLAMYYLNQNDFLAAEENANTIVKLAPGQAHEQAIAAIAFNKCGDPQRALKQMRKAMRLCPVQPMWFLTGLGHILRVLEKFDEAIEVFNEMIARDPEQSEGQIGLAATLGEVGRTDEAEKAAKAVLRINPEFSINAYLGNITYRDSDQIARLKVGLQIAGLPE